jgi:hypothetical protein
MAACCPSRDDALAVLHLAHGGRQQIERPVLDGDEPLVDVVRQVMEINMRATKRLAQLARVIGVVR